VLGDPRGLPSSAVPDRGSLKTRMAFEAERAQAAAGALGRRAAAINEPIKTF
jgi:hypothetical protein